VIERGFIAYDGNRYVDYNHFWLMNQHKISDTRRRSKCIGLARRTQWWTWADYDGDFRYTGFYSIPRNDYFIALTHQGKMLQVLTTGLSEDEVRECVNQLR